ncbi:MAG: hypothetical protein H6706_17315 [Myxococcales bacterium]|nr:hypothetical protein [Myxococcales bacterium]
MHRHALLCLLGVIGLGLGGCADEAQDPQGPAVDQAQQAIYAPIRRAVPTFGDAVDRFSAAERASSEEANEIARRKREHARFADCACVDQRCAMLCLLEEELAEPIGEPHARPVECLACGRETGFLPRPELRLEVVGEKTVRLSWDAVDGADKYAVHAMRWPDSDQDGTAGARSLVWETEATELQLTLETGSYTFSLVAWGPERLRSQPSLPIDVDL